MKKSFYAVIALLFVIVVGLYYYFTFPSINIHEPMFWGVLLMVFLLLSIFFAVRSLRVMLGRGRLHFSDVKNFPVLRKFF